VLFRSYFPEKKKAKPHVHGNSQRSCSIEDGTLIEKAKSSRNGTDFTRLFEGDWSKYRDQGKSQSEADQALTNSLCFWTNGDVAQMDRLFRLSGLFRAKWNEKRGEQTYGEITMDKALASTHDFYAGAHEYNSQGKTAQERGDQDMNPTVEQRTTITNIRHDKDLKAFEKKRAIATLVIEDLKARGRLIRTENREVYYFDDTTKALVEIHDQDFQATLHNRFGLNATETETRFMEEELLTHALCHGEQTSIHRLAYWNPNSHKLYVSMNNGTMFVLDGHDTKQQDNGTDGVLFLIDRRTEPIDPVFSDDRTHFNALFNDLSIVGTEDEKEQMVALLQVWFFTLFFLEALPVRPIPTLIGPTGSGKTTLGRRIGCVIYGSDFQVGAFRSDQTGEQDFLAAICAKRFVVFDNADARIRWLPDHLARLATGAEIERRKLYTTNTLETFRPECFLIITSRDPQWKRDDVATRLLPISMGKINKGKVPEAELQRRISRNRNQIWGTILSILNPVVAALHHSDTQFTSSHRLADYHCLGSYIAPILGIGEQFDAGMAHLEKTQLHLLAEGDERLELLGTWLEVKPTGWTEVVVSSKECFEELRQMYVGADRSFPFRSVGSLGTWIGRNVDLITSALDVVVTPDHSKTARRWKFQNQGVTPRCHQEQPSKLLESKGKIVGDTVTPYSEKTMAMVSSAEEEVFTDVS
jgi:hypothetical protein